MPQAARPAGRGVRLSPPRLSGYVAMAAAIGIGVWLITSSGSGHGLKTVKIGPSASATQPSTTATAPTLLSAAQLAARAASLGAPVYWAGSQAGMGYGLTRDDRGDVIITYTPSAGRRSVLTVATIPLRNAFAATQQLAAKPGAVSKDVANGGLLYYRTDRPSTYVAFPGLDYLVEIDAQAPAQARQLALSGRIQRVG